MTLAAACEHRNTPVRLTRTTRSHSSSVIASVALTTFTAALLIRTSSRPPPKRAACAIPVSTLMRSEERRVGKEGESLRSLYLCYQALIGRAGEVWRAEGL